MRKRFCIVAISVLMLVLFVGCGKEQNVDLETVANMEEATEQEDVVVNTEEDTKEQEVLDTQVEALNVRLKIPRSWKYEIDNGLSVNFEGGILTVFSDPVKEKMSIEELKDKYTAEPNGIVEKISDGHEDVIAGQTMYVFDYTGKANENDIYGTVYQFSTENEYYLVTFAFLEGYDYKEIMTQIMESLELVPYASEEEKTTSDLEYPIGNVKKYLSGKAKKQKVYLPGVIEGLKYDKDLEETEFNIWYQRGKSYYKGDFSVTVSDEDMNTYDLPELKEGKTYYFLCDVYKDGSFGLCDEYNIVPCKKGDSLKKVYSKYRKACKLVSSKSLMRSPKKNKFKMVKFSGQVLQIVDREYQLEFLLSLNDGTIVNVVYDGKGQKKILEDDQITIFGEYLCNYSYTTVLGANKEVARINAVIIDR